MLDQRFELVAPVADRGIGESWRCHDKQHGDREVCAKLLRALPAGVTAMPRELADQLKSLRAFRHDNALAVINHGVWEGRPYLVYDPFDGRSIGSALDESRSSGARLDLTLLEALFDRACLTVEAAHRAPRQLLHLAITPGCVLFRGDAPDPLVRIVDFGLARHASADPTAPVRSARSLSFPAPEQLTPDGRTGPLTDVFSLGGLLREMLSLPPELGLTLSPAGLERRRDDVPEALWEVVSRAMASRPDERFPSAEALREAAAKAWRSPVRPKVPAAVAPSFATEEEEGSTTEVPISTADRLAARAALEGRVRARTVPGMMPSSPFPSAPMSAAGIMPSSPLPALSSPLPSTPAFSRPLDEPPAPAPAPSFPTEDDDDGAERFGRTMAVEASGFVAGASHDIESTASIPQLSTLQPPVDDDVESTQEMSDGDEFLRTMAVDQDALQRQVSAQQPTPDVSAARAVLRPTVQAPALNPLKAALGPPVAPPAPAPKPAAPAVAPQPVDPSQSMRYKVIVAVGILFIPVLLGLFLIMRARH